MARPPSFKPPRFKVSDIKVPNLRLPKVAWPPLKLPPFDPGRFKMPPIDREAIKRRLRVLLASREAERLAGWGRVAGKVLSNQLHAEWAGSPPHRWLIAWPRTSGRAAAPVDLRPPRLRRGKAIAAGRFTFDGLVLEPGPGAEPWHRANPSRAFAVALHGMSWLPDLLATPGNARTALSLVLGWHGEFGRWNLFSWSAPVLERRVFNLACSMKALAGAASVTESEILLDSLARQARHLLLGDGEPVRAAEQAAAAAIAGCVLAGKAGERLREKALAKLDRVLPVSVLPDGGHASRSPESALELLLDLRTLDGALQQLGEAPTPELARAIDRLTGALRVFVLPDGRLPAMQGGEAGEPERIAAAMSHDQGAALGFSLPYTGYQRLVGPRLQAIADTGAPASGPWSRTACAQPLALEVMAGSDRLIVNTGWSPRAVSAQALRMTPAGSCANVSDASAGYPLQGLRARILGHRLEGAVKEVQGRRHNGEDGAWLEYSHDGWVRTFGLTHARRLYIDYASDELRGEDLLAPSADSLRPASFQARPRQAFLMLRFQIHPDVKASLAMDQKSVMLQGAKSGGWWLRNDAPEVRLEPAVFLLEGRPQATLQVAMRVPVRRDGVARLRWKLSAVDS
jgi:uncharacterized heparinase superfamily protein